MIDKGAQHMGEEMSRYNLGSFVVLICLFGMWLFVENFLIAQQLPEEYESMGGHGISLNHAAVAATDGVAAVRVNPALLSKQKVYNLACGYQWPTVGREFYQAGVVDGRTSKISAGISYTSFSDNYIYYRQSEKADINDSPIARRGSLALSQTLGQWALGVGFTYVEGFPFWSELVFDGKDSQKPQLKKGVGANLGISFALNSQIDLGAAVENISNPKVSSYLPRTGRVGLAYRWAQELQLLFDYRNRERVPEFEGPAIEEANGKNRATELDPEQAIIGGFEAQIQDVIRLTGSIGISADKRQFASAGLAVVNKSFTLAYGIRRPNLEKSVNQHAISTSFDLSI